MIAHAVRWFTALAAAATAAACGGGLIAGVGSGGSGFGVASGIVTGFGSIIVDGTPWDVRDARIEALVDPAQPAALTEAKLGQHVEIDFQTPGVAKTVRVEANVVGRVSAVDAAATPPRLVAAGQTVRINTDPASGPVTVFVGYASIGDVQTGDAVEIHGSSEFDATLAANVIQASRIEKLAALPAGRVRVAGSVEALAAGVFRIGGLSIVTSAGTVIVPGSRVLANGQRVIAWGREPLGAGPTLTADFIRIKDAPSGSSAGEIAGAISRFDPARLAFEVNGIAVDARGAHIVPAGQVLADGVYVVASGTFLSDGTLSASLVRIRKFKATDATVELSGLITDFTSSASFSVRDVAVDASAATLNGCGNTPLADGVFVEVGGNVAGSVVKAINVTCDAAPPADATLTWRGTAGNVDVNARTFTLTLSGTNARAAGWTDTTLFVDLTPATLAGTAVEMEGFVRQGVLVATKIRPAN